MLVQFVFYQTLGKPNLKLHVAFCYWLGMEKWHMNFSFSLNFSMLFLKHILLDIPVFSHVKWCFMYVFRTICINILVV